ncbi:MAG: zinc ribbon domain-containing protein [Candidatus Anammoxibacter sp.]
MINQIEVLIRLQSICNKLRKLKQDKEYRFNDVKENEEHIKEKNEVVLNEDKDLKSVQIKIDNKELDLKTIEEQINKYKGQQNQIKTNKEFSALKEEIQGKDADKSVIEDAILEMLNELEEKKEDVKNLKEDVKKTEDTLSELNKTVETDVKEIEDEIKEVDAKKTSMLEALDTQTRYHFERLITNKNGIAVADVMNNACQSCYFAVTAQTINMLLSEQETVFCHSCGRILYLSNKEHALKQKE